MDDIPQDGDGISGSAGAYYHEPGRRRSIESKVTSCGVPRRRRQLIVGLIQPYPTIISLSGWTGRVMSTGENEDGEILCTVKWDAATLKKMSPEFRERCDDEGLACSATGSPRRSWVR